MYRFGKLENLLDTKPEESLTPPAIVRQSSEDFLSAVKKKLDEIQLEAIQAGAQQQR